MTTLAKAKFGRPFVPVILQRNEEVGTVDEEDPFWVKSPQHLILARNATTEPVLKGFGLGVFTPLAKVVWVTGSGPLVRILVVIPSERRAALPRVSIDLLLDLPGPQGLEESAAVQPIGIGSEPLRPVKAPRQLTGQIEPPRHFFLASGSGIGGGQRVEHSFAEEQAEEPGLLHLPHHFQVVEVPLMQRRRHKVFVLLKGLPVHACSLEELLALEVFFPLAQAIVRAYRVCPSWTRT